MIRTVNINRSAAPLQNARARVRMRLLSAALSGFVLLSSAAAIAQTPATFDNYPVVKLQSLDKITARTMVFEARVGSTVQFGPLYIKIQACRKAPPIETPEAASFLQIWESPPDQDAQWVFSGWMFASSPALSPMDHPVYDVWVIDCLEHKTGEEPPAPATSAEEAEAADDDAEPASPPAAEPDATPPAQEPLFRPADDEDAAWSPPPAGDNAAQSLSTAPEALPDATTPSPVPTPVPVITRPSERDFELEPDVTPLD